MDTVGQRLTALRKWRGWSQDQLAAEMRELSGRATFGREEVSRWENDHRIPTPFWADLLARALAVPVTSLQPIEAASNSDRGSALRTALDWLVSEPPQISETRVGRRIGAGLAARIQARVVELRHLDDELSGGDLAPLVLREYAATSRLIDRSSYQAEVGRSLLTSLGELGQITGWVLSDAGLHHQAQAHYLDGFAAARTAGDAAGAANLLSCLAYQWTNQGHAPDAALLAAAAVRGAQTGCTPTVRALVSERLAYAHAHLGDHGATARDLDRVDELFDLRGRGDADPEWVYWLSRDEVLVMAARCWTHLGDARRAGVQLADVLTRYSAEQAREQALYRAFLAEAYMNAGELDAAADALQCAATYAATTASARAWERIDRVSALLGERRIVHRANVA
jgi:transcriptional regulator with XRE-family HTH domain